MYKNNSLFRTKFKSYSPLRPIYNFIGIEPEIALFTSLPDIDCTSKNYKLFI